jgi:hypothetical protein
MEKEQIHKALGKAQDLTIKLMDCYRDFVRENFEPTQDENTVGLMTQKVLSAFIGAIVYHLVIDCQQEDYIKDIFDQCVEKLRILKHTIDTSMKNVH